MRVPFNGFSNTLISELTRLNSNQVNLQKQLSSGQRIEEAYEDPMASGRALSTSTEKARIQTQARNLNRAQLIGEFSGETLEQMKVVADKASLDANKTDGLTSQADYEARGLQTNQLIEQVLRVGNAQVAGDYLFAGANTGEEPFVANRYEEGDYQVDANGVEIRELQSDPGSSVLGLDPATLTFINSDGEIVDRETGEATTSPPTDAASSLGGTPPYVVEWAAEDTGQLKEWNGTDYEDDAVDGAGDAYGEVTIANDGTADFVGFVDKVAITDEMVGMVSHIEYTGTTDPAQDVSFRVGEGATIAPFSRGGTNLEYLEFMNDMVSLRDAYFEQKLEPDNPGVTHTAKASAVEDLVPKFDEHQNTVLLGIVEFGSLQQGIEVTQSINESRFNELEKLSSRELDIDVAETIVKLNRSQTAYEAALTSGSSIMQLSLLDFIR